MSLGVNVTSVLSVAARLSVNPLPPDADETERRAHVYLKRAFLQLLLVSLQNDVVQLTQQVRMEFNFVAVMSRKKGHKKEGVMFKGQKGERNRERRDIKRESKIGRNK